MKIIKIFEVGDFVDLSEAEIAGKAKIWLNGEANGVWKYREERGLVVNTPSDILVDGKPDPYYHVLTQSDVVLGILAEDMQNAEYGGHVNLGYLAGEDPEE